MAGEYFKWQRSFDWATKRWARTANLAHRLHRFLLAVVPTKFEPPAIEALFLHDFRLAGLRSTSYACCIAVVGYVLIGAAELAFIGWSAPEMIRRLFLVSLLSLIIGMILIRPTVLLDRFTVGFGALILFTYVSSVSITHLSRSDDPTTAVNPTALLGLWMIYGFVRLPIGAAVFVGVAGGACALLGSRLTNMPDPAVRTFIYLLIGNALGITLSRSIELRERSLFLQRQTLEVAQLELARRSQIAEQASAEKTRLIASVGHDLRQPMMAARLHLSVLIRRLRAGDVDGVHLQADKVQESVKLLGETLEHLLLAARYEAGSEPISIQAVPLSRLLRKLEDLCGPQNHEGRGELIVRLPPVEIVVSTDEQIAVRAIVNLVSNALKFTREDPSVRSRVVVRARAHGGICTIAIIDNGIGIAAPDMASIWEPFFQVGNRERNREGGLGLGLYLVKQSLIRLPGHRITLKSSHGKGTCFVLSLPGARSTDERTRGAEPETAVRFRDDGEQDFLRGMYVLLVEDDLEARNAIQAQLAEWGVHFVGARDVDEVLSVHSMAERRVNAMIADFRLPGNRNGIESIGYARDTLKYCPSAILVTAEIGPQFSSETLPERVAFLQKPFDPKVLYDMLSTALIWELEEERGQAPGPA